MTVIRLGECLYTRRECWERDDRPDLDRLSSVRLATPQTEVGSVPGAAVELLGALRESERKRRVHDGAYWTATS